jgi:hypothetical protein
MNDTNILTGSITDETANRLERLERIEQLLLPLIAEVSCTEGEDFPFSNTERAGCLLLDKTCGFPGYCVIDLSPTAFADKAPPEVRRLLWQIFDREFPTAEDLEKIAVPERLFQILKSIALVYLDAAQCVSCVFPSEHTRSEQPQDDPLCLVASCKTGGSCTECTGKRNLAQGAEGRAG